jgi:hypothetical protein
MDTSTHITRVLRELAEFGVRNDGAQTERGRRMLNITPDTGQFLSILVSTSAKVR